MGRIRRYRTALSRHHRSKGHGIHSPFAFGFVRFVLREKLPYYCYDDMGDTRQAVVESLRGMKSHPRVISFKGLKMLFRITNHFNPENILEMGSCYGLTSTSMLNVSSGSALWLYDPQINSYQVTGRVLLPYIDSIECYDQIEVAIDEYIEALPPTQIPFILINTVEQPDFEILKTRLASMLTGECVIVLRNISRSDRMMELWKTLKGSMAHGQSFTNEKTAVIVAKRKLNLEHFFLWF